MSKKILSLFILISCLISFAFAENQVEAVVKEALDATETCVCIRTDVPGVEVFLNGTSQGKTELVIRDLLPGLYNLDLVKAGYEKLSCVISVKNGYSLEYSFTMEKIYGKLQVLNVPNDALVTVGSSVSSTVYASDKDFVDYSLDVEPGEYELKVKKFGYEEYSQPVKIEAHETTEVTADLQPVAFELTNFACNKECFNPDYSGPLGKCTCSFSVTASGSANVCITDSTGLVVWEKQFIHFTSWGQTFDWNGRDSENKVLPDGIYCITITAAGDSQKVYVTLDSSISYPLISAGADGSAIGNVPAILSENKSFVMPYFNGGVIQENGQNGAQMHGILTAGVLGNFGKHFELNVAGMVFPGLAGPNRVDLAACLKVYGQVPVRIGTAGTLCYGGEISYGYKMENLVNSAAILGFDFPKFYTGVTYTYNIYPNSTNVVGLAVAYRPVKAFRVGFWGQLLDSYQAGIDLSFMPASSAFIINAKGGVEFIEEKTAVTVTFGLSYLF